MHQTSNEVHVQLWSAYALFLCLYNEYPSCSLLRLSVVASAVLVLYKSSGMLRSNVLEI